MPFVSQPLLEAAVDGLKGKHPLAVIVLPTMVRSGVPVSDNPDEAKPYGSDSEVEALRAWFQILGAPENRPFRAVWEENPSEYWRDERYPGRSLQRMRTDRVKRGQAFLQLKVKGQSKDSWAIKTTCGNDLAGGNERGYPVRLVDLAIWYGRQQEVADLDELAKWFLTEFPLEQAGLIGTIYSEEVPDHYLKLSLAPEALDQSEYAQALGAAPLPATLDGSLSDFVERLDKCVADSGFIASPGLVARVVNAWAVGDVVVLVGLPGTGKTKFAHTLEKCLRKEFGDLSSTWLAIRPDFEETDLIGYERLDGNPELREFAHRVLKSEQPLAAHLIVLEEFNLGQVENYLSAVLVALQDPERRVGLPAGEEARLPQDALILATCNSYLDEPESRLRIGFATKRRSTLIPMTNGLFERFEQEGDKAIVEITLQMIDQERSRIQERDDAGLASALDSARLNALKSVGSASDISDATWKQWVAICATILGSSEGREFLTVGLIRDVALSLAYSQRSAENEADALGRAVADKLVHQLRGPKARADELLKVIGELPNMLEISRLLERMKSSPGDELLSLV